MAKTGLCVLLCLAMGGACSKRAPQGQGAAAPHAEAQSSAPPTGTARYGFAAGESTIKFAVKSTTGTHEGSFGKFSGAIVLLDGDPQKASVTIEIDMLSLRTNDPKLLEVMKSALVFDVAKYPKARFVSTAVRMGGEFGATNTVQGTLDLHGATKAIAIPATVHVRSNGVDFDAEVALNRKDFGLSYAGPAGDVIGDEVVVTLLIYANRT